MPHPVGVEPEPFELGEHLVTASDKLLVVDQLLAHLRPLGHKVLIFSQMTRVLDILQDYLGYRGMCITWIIKVCTLPGLSTCVPVKMPLFRPIDNIRTMMIVWTIRGKIIRTVLCCIVYHSCTQLYSLGQLTSHD